MYSLLGSLGIFVIRTFCLKANLNCRIMFPLLYLADARLTGIWFLFITIPYTTYKSKNKNVFPLPYQSKDIELETKFLVLFISEHRELYIGSSKEFLCLASARILLLVLFLFPSFIAISMHSFLLLLHYFSIPLLPLRPFLPSSFNFLFVWILPSLSPFTLGTRIGRETIAPSDLTRGRRFIATIGFLRIALYLFF